MLQNKSNFFIPLSLRETKQIEDSTESIQGVPQSGGEFNSNSQLKKAAGRGSPRKHDNPITRITKPFIPIFTYL